MFTKEFLNKLLTRAIKTFAQTAAALIAVDAATSIINLDWPYILGVSATAFVLSVLTTIAEFGLADEDKKVALAGPQVLTRGVRSTANTPEQAWANRIDDLHANGVINAEQWNDLDGLLAIVADGHGNITKRGNKIISLAVKTGEDGAK